MAESCEQSPVLVESIFDDLKDLQEDVTEFDCSGINVTCSGDGGLYWFKKGKGETFYISEIDKFILKLRQMEATLKRRAK